MTIPIAFHRHCLIGESQVVGLRNLRSGDGKMKQDVVQRFLSKVQKGKGCWKWLSATIQNGYGVFYLNGKTEYAHRLAWEMKNGPIPAGKEICHSCDIKTCVNPRHMFLGTRQDNMQDAISKGRFCSGTKSHLHKLTDEQVIEIRRTYSRPSYGKSNAKELAAHYNINRGMIENIVAGRNWKHLL